MRLTSEQLIAKLEALGAVDSPEIFKAMMQAAKNVEAKAKTFCTPGLSPYWKAPYSDDSDKNYLLAHMRDQISSTVVADGSRLNAIIFVQDSAEGEPWRYSLYVHTGTYDYAIDPEMAALSSTGKVPGMKGMPPRPVIPDAARTCQNQTLALIAEGVRQHIKWTSYGGGYIHPSMAK